MTLNEALNVLEAEKPLDKIILKAIEELGELSVALAQYLNKPGKCDGADVIEEIVDVEMNLTLLKRFFPIQEWDRNAKFLKFIDSKDFKKYYEQSKLRQR